MKAATWEPSAGALAAYLASGVTNCTPADLYTITLISGTVLRYSSLDAPVTVNGNTFIVGPGIERSKIRQSIGISVDTMTLDVVADASVLVGSVPILQAIAAGVFAGAEVLVERLFYDTSMAPRGTVAKFFGRMGSCQVTRGSARIDVVSHSELLDVMVPSEVYQPGCHNALFDPQCGVLAASFTNTFTVSLMVDPKRLQFYSAVTGIPGVANTTDYYALGVITFTSGLNAGVSRTCRNFDTGAPASFRVISPWPYAPAVGDTFTVTPGCDKQSATCNTKFSNLARFRGQEFIPAPETII